MAGPTTRCSTWRSSTPEVRHARPGLTVVLDDYSRGVAGYAHPPPSGPHPRCTRPSRSTRTARPRPSRRALQRLHLRLDPVTGVSVWLRDHADHHLAVLMDPDGPFKKSVDEARPGESLPYTAQPEGLFSDVRADPL